MRRVVVLPQPEGPSMTKNSPSSTVKLESWTATKSSKFFLRLSTLISAIAPYSGKWLTMTKPSVPVRITAKDQP